MTLISRIIIVVLFLSVPFCIGFFRNKNKNMTVKEYVIRHKYWIGFFATYLLVSIGLMLFNYETYKQQYNNIYEHSIINGVGSVSNYDKRSVKLTLKNNQEYIFIPQNMLSSDFERYISNMGFTIEKRANSDTIFLIKGNTIKICLIEKPI